MTPGVKATTLVKFAPVDRQALDLLGCDGERPLAALCLDERRFGGHGDRFDGCAQFERQRRHADTVATANHDPRAPRVLNDAAETSTVYVSGATFGKHVVARLSW